MSDLSRYAHQSGRPPIILNLWVYCPSQADVGKPLLRRRKAGAQNYLSSLGIMEDDEWRRAFDKSSSPARVI